ncbi:hypothetical protein FB451DRAFT_1406157 [Mycena latifolia]|nr:hypothetical protein FB451DRAFT_1507173 [Mycena latifolia]KAJ7458991.1 hypothetical protein FB451DRAFT_1406157 [Mycena latifolia]
MPRAAKNSSHAQRGSSGAFVSTQSVPSAGETLTGSDGEDSEDPLAWESGIDSESEDDGEWEQRPRPMTYAEREAKRAAQKEKAAEKRRKAEIRSAEQRLAGAPDNQQGAHISPVYITHSTRKLTGKKRGPYGIGGLSKRSAQEKRKKLRADFKNGSLRISEAEFNRKMASLQPQSTASMKTQVTLFDMFKKRPRAASITSDDIQTPPESDSSKRRKTSDPAPSTSSVSLREEEEESSDSAGDLSAEESEELEFEDEIEISPEVLETEARFRDGDAAVDSISAADEVAEWVHTVLDDAAPLEPAELGSLAEESLKTSRKAKDFRSTVLFAALVDFYR